MARWDHLVSWRRGCFEALEPFSNVKDYGFQWEDLTVGKEVVLWAAAEKVPHEFLVPAGGEGHAGGSTGKKTLKKKMVDATKYEAELFAELRYFGFLFQSPVLLFSGS